MQNRLPPNGEEDAPKGTLIPRGEGYPLAFKCYDLEKKVMYSPEELLKMGVFNTSTGLFVSVDGQDRPLKRLCHTGLKDSSGNPLFEGDICKIVVSIDMGIGFKSSIERWAVMRWHRGSFIFQMPDILGQRGAFEVVESHYQGNEWLNPELIANLKNQ